MSIGKVPGGVPALGLIGIGIIILCQESGQGTDARRQTRETPSSRRFRPASQSHSFPSERDSPMTRAPHAVYYMMQESFSGSPLRRIEYLLNGGAHVFSSIAYRWK